MKTLYIFIAALIVISNLTFSQENYKFSLLPGKNEKSLSLLSHTNKHSFTKKLYPDFQYKLSVGGGIKLYNDFIFADAIADIDIGFHLSKYFIFINGAEFIFHKTTTYNYGVAAEEMKLYTDILIAPSFFIQIKNFMLSAGGGPGIGLPFHYYRLHIFFLTRTGYKISDDTSINLSIKVPLYIYGKIEGMSISLMYGFDF